MIEILIYDKYQKEYYEVIPVKKIEEVMDKVKNRNYNDYTREQDGNEIKYEILNELQQLIKENCEVEE